jgi:hypothetical protein
MVAKENCIERICNLPLDYKITDKSAYELAKESKFAELHTRISVQDIKEYLLRKIDLIDKWVMWSEDKRTWGYYLSITPHKSLIGELDRNAKLVFEKSFSNNVDACAEFILMEISSILDINTDKRKQYEKQ